MSSSHFSSRSALSYPTPSLIPPSLAPPSVPSSTPYSSISYSPSPTSSPSTSSPSASSSSASSSSTPTPCADPTEVANTSTKPYTVPFISRTPPSQWLLFLQHMQYISSKSNNLFIIDKVISYTDPPIPGRLTVTAARPMIRASGSLAVFGGQYKDNQGRVPPGSSGHCYCAFWKDGVWGVYNSSFDDCVQFEEDLEMLTSFRYMLNGMRCNNVEVKELWVGGGGNWDGTCVEMTRAWIEEEIVKKRGAELGKWEGRKNWKKILRNL